ncbi:melanoma-associated antigen D2-like [Leptopilina boulardi]|uniref:melanoma-associated antigen D2-like n=1 Tax=Leptopilina boulardi TaxID=63433 RepID=UPI0021F5A440|nr:melanoma-associated antigen D2-like [Leptopilina boulardi]
MSRRSIKHRIVESDSNSDNDDEGSVRYRSQTQNRRKKKDNNSTMSQSQRSQGKRKSQIENNTQFVVDDDDDVSMSTQRTQTVLPDDELNRLMGHVVRYILVTDRSRHPILRQNIQKNVLNNSKHYRTVMDFARRTFRKVFGYNLVEIDNGKYILINEISNNDYHVTFPMEKNQMVLLFICLSHIFMNDTVSTEDNLFNFLRKLAIVDGDNFRHNYFGDINQLITVDFIKQRYLTRSKVENSEPEKFQYEWGSRAEHELDKLEVLQFVSRIYRNKPVEEWTSQLKNIQHNIRDFMG